MKITKQLNPLEQKIFLDQIDLEVKTAQALHALDQELIRARKKHPDPKWMIEALVEELGEFAADAIHELKETGRIAPGNINARHAAACLMRLLTEGTTPMPADQADETNFTPTDYNLMHLQRLGDAAKTDLTKNGVSE